MAGPRLLTVGHGTLAADELAALLLRAGVEQLVDVRSFPGSRRHPHFGRAEMERWVPSAGVAYRWEPRLGGRRRPLPESPHVALRHPAFRGYADHMESTEFAASLDELLAEAERHAVSVMCAETLWWRCHRRLIADAATVLHGAEVLHLGHDDRLAGHRLTEGVRQVGDRLLYDAGQIPLA